MDTWQTILANEKKQLYFQNIEKTLKEKRQSGVNILPPQDDIFSAFHLTPFDQIKVVILGQDPYHGENQAHGLSFSVKPGIKVPPSLHNIYKSLENDIESFSRPNHGYLESWARQGVLLLNTVLTVEKGMAHAHKSLGWERFTDVIIEHINNKCDHVVFLLWGNHAQKKGANINKQQHLVLKAPHPSPLSAHRGFLTCRHFSQTNDFLLRHDKTPIHWHLPTL